MEEETLEQRCRRLEFYETPEWAARAILNKELTTQLVIDPCCGAGILSEAVIETGSNVIAYDIEDWGYRPAGRSVFIQKSWLEVQALEPNATVFCNPPFSLATNFIEHAFQLGARKIIAFQRFAFWESRKRQEFWARHPPNRIYICGDRADCWRYDIPEDRRTSSTTTAHAWYVWERGHPLGTLLGHMWKADAT